MNRRQVRLALGVGALVALLGWSAGHRVTGEESPEKPKDQVVILNNMQLLKGSISRSPNGFVVTHAAGKLVIPNDEVRVIGDDLQDAYRRLVESFPEPTASTHYQLALWGWSHHLKNEARDQLVMSLDRDPDYERARVMLTRIDAQAAAERRQAAATKIKPAAPRIVNGIELPEVESLAGLSRETAAVFTSRVQPLLINRCGNASCHGPNTPSEFQLEQIRGTGSASRLVTERNLAAVLEQLDPEQLKSSPLLTVPMGSHGGLNKAIFFGPTGERQLAILKAWAKSASKERSHDQQMVETRREPQRTKPNFPKSPSVSLDDEESEVTDDEHEEISPALATVSEQKSVKREIKADEETAEEDAFDPEVFNRRYHGKIATKEPVRKKKR